MKIRHKGIWHERGEDAPFIGAVISAIDCNFNCNNCFNQHVKDNNIELESSEEIIEKIKSNKFNQGIILAGLEWTLQKKEMMELIDCADKNGLKIMLYTGLDEDKFKELYPGVYNYDIYIKFGEYDERKKCNNYQMYNVKLSSKNQSIKKISRSKEKINA